MQKQKFRGKKVAVVGLGKSGQAVVKFLLRQGAKVFATDRDKPNFSNSNPGLELETGGHTEQFLTGSELLVISPGVKEDSLPVKWARQNNCPVISEIELAYQVSAGEIAAITGTNGKTTSVNLLGAILKRAHLATVLAGNVGEPFVEVLEELTRDTKIVLEVSSFQLKWIDRFHPNISCILNFSANHLDWHPSVEDYLNAKKGIYKNQTREDFLILNYDDPILGQLRPDSDARVVYYSLTDVEKNAYLKDGYLTVSLETEERIIAKDELILRGEHNLENALAVSLIARIWGVPASVIAEELATFKGLEHRLEFLEPVREVTFVNDSKSTTVDSTRRALSLFARPVILIAGGRDKGNDYQVLLDTMRKKVKLLVAIGESKNKIKDSFGGIVPVIESNNLTEAVNDSFCRSQPGDYILLSPMCASLDEFSSYIERGNIFKREVDNLTQL